MAEIPLSLVQRRVSRGGDYAPAGAVRYPGMSAPPGGLAEAIGQAGRQVAGSLATVFEVKQRERDAADTIAVQDHAAQFTDKLLDAQQNLAVDQSIPPLEMRGRLEQQRDELLSLHAEQLPARLRPKFLATARQAAVQPLYHLDQVGVKRLGEQATATFEHRSDQLLRQRLASTSAIEQQRLDKEHDQLIDEYAATGFIAPGQAPILKQKHRDILAVTDMESRIRLDTKGALEQLELGPDENPTLPPKEYVELLDKARSQHQQQLQWYDAAQRRADAAVAKAQEGTAGQLWADFVRLDPTPANSEQYRTILAQAEQAWKDGKINLNQYQEITNRGRVLLDRSLQPGAEKDNVALERELTVDLARATTDEAVKAVQARLLNQAAELRPETIQRLNSAVEQRLQANHYSNTKEYRDGVDIILRAGVVPDAGFMGGGGVEEETKRKLSLALDAYEQQMSTLAATDVNEMKRAARDLAYKLRDVYLPVEDRAPGSIPAPVKNAPNEEALKTELTRMQHEGVPTRQLDSFRRWWQQDQERKRQKALEEQSKPAPTGRTRPGGR